MKPTHGWTGLLLAFAFTGVAQGQAFDSGSDGSFGAVDLKYPDDCPDWPHEVWMDLPPDGVIHATTVTIESCALRFRNNARNTPVYLLAQGDVGITSSDSGPRVGAIDVSGFEGTSLEGGVPGPGGFPGGRPYVAGEEPGPGAGPGGGLGGDSSGWPDHSAYPGRGMYGAAIVSSDPYSDRPNDGKPYGSQLLMPLIGGSGGGGQKRFISGPPSGTNHLGGGGGGGAILIASNTRIIVGGYGIYDSPAIRADGSRWHDGSPPGSGGAIRLVAPRVEGVKVEGNDGIFYGRISASGSDGNWGRIRIDAIHHPVTIHSSGDTPFTIGRLMKTFLDITPRLDITHAAGTDIPLDTSTPVLIVLPIGAPPEQSLTLRAEGFTGTVPVRVQALLENGEAIVIDDTITMSGSVTSKTFPITLPENVGVRLYAWTRED